MKNKTLALASVLSLLFSAGHAQTEKGTFRLGGSLGLSLGTTNTVYPSPGTGSIDTKTSGFTFSPSIAYAFLNRFSPGVVVSYGSSTSTYQNQTQNYDVRTISFVVGPTVRYYFPIGKIALFPDLQYLWGSQTLYGPAYSSTAGGTVNSKLTTARNIFMAGVGASYFLNKNIGIEVVTYYQKDNDNSENNIQPTVTVTNLVARVGLQIYFAKQN